MQVETFHYDNRTVRNFGIATVVFGIVGMLVGLWIAFELAFPELNLGLKFTTFGRLRPLHTNAIIFAFVGNAIFAGVYYSLPRLLKTPMFSNLLSNLHFWGWQAIIAAAAITLPLGITTGKEYAELEWPIDIAITLVWVIFGINMFGTILKRRERHLYVAIWFYIATWAAIALLHIVNSMEMPVHLFKSYSMYAGVQDALVQWWYGHNAVAFFLTTPVLGLMYYFMPKAAGRPVFSYRLSILHFWTLVFLYIWAGPHHLLYTSLPSWAQSLGVVFSLMLIAPSWGGMINGLLTLRGAWDKVREDPILKFMVVAVTAYGMSTFEGPMLSLKSLNKVAHFTDWIVAHVHVGGLGWNGFLIFGMLYWMVPRLYKTKLFSVALANTHFWIGTLGIILYVIPMYWAGLTSGIMWTEFNELGMLKYPNFLEISTGLVPLYAMRGIGGLLYFTGAVLMVYNLAKTMASGTFLAREEASAPPMHADGHTGRTFWHRWIERRPIQMAIASLLLLGVGTGIELIPTFLVKSNVETIASVKPYTPLEVEGRDIYIREGCYNCHSQMVRPFRAETMRYKGEYSKAGEFVYDHPFQWGSKRTGPDLHRLGGKYPDSWHYNHMLDPTSMSDGSIMPPYPSLLTDDLDVSHLESKISALRSVGVPYPDGYEKKALADLNEQAAAITENLKKDNIQGAKPEKEIIALIAYLQRLGTDIRKSNQAVAAN
ncbi:MAG: cytochrome-c oxidase, cbb3-type subunit I [Bacteroidia bacterium]|nr:cytochrome-c oxidase, cbb3-type subunit I [Bacteroidia bacterium]